MSKIIKIDDKARIKITPMNYILQYWELTKPKNGKEGKSQWITGGYFPNMVSCATEYILNAPNASSEAIDDLEGVIKAIKEAELRIKKVFNK